MKYSTSAVLLGGVSLFAVAACSPADAPPQTMAAPAIELIDDGRHGGMGPVFVSFDARGGEPADGFIRNCPGHVAGEGVPVRLMSETYELHVSASAESLAGLVVRDSEDGYACVRAEDGIASHRFETPDRGEYRVWPALAGSGAQARVRLGVSEFEVQRGALRPFDIDTLGEARLGTVVFEPEEDDGRQRIARGPIQSPDSMRQANSSCPGHGDLSAPDVTLTLDGEEDRLSLYATSSTDLVIAVLAPDGEWHCNDDFSGLDPAVVLSGAPEGDYQIWTGSFSQNASGSHETFAIRGEPDWSDDGSGSGSIDLTPSAGVTDASALDWEAEPAFGVLELTGEDGHPSLQTRFDGGDSARDLGFACVGWMDFSRPDAVVRTGETAERLSIYAVSDRDTAMVVRAPDGEILCNDDFEGLDPAVQIGDAEPGDYAVWVGGYSGGEGVALVSATTAEPDWSQQVAGPGAVSGDEWLTREELDAIHPLLGAPLAALETLALGHILLIDETPEIDGEDGYVRAEFPDLSLMPADGGERVDMSGAVLEAERLDDALISVRLTLPSSAPLTRWDDGDSGTLDIADFQFQGVLHEQTGLFVDISADAAGIASSAADGTATAELELFQARLDAQETGGGLWSISNMMDLSGLRFLDAVEGLSIGNLTAREVTREADLAELAELARVHPDSHAPDPATMAAHFGRTLQAFGSGEWSYAAQDVVIGAPGSADAISIHSVHYEGEVSGLREGDAVLTLSAAVREIDTGGSPVPTGLAVEDGRASLRVSGLPDSAELAELVEVSSGGPQWAFQALNETGADIELDARILFAASRVDADGALSAAPGGGMTGEVTLLIEDVDALAAAFGEIDQEFARLLTGTAEPHEDASRIVLNFEEGGAILVNGAPIDDVLR
ncbi:DUF2125 domain-containing protein [Glycocaulis profundi]|nr:DUF2125 domain-containing protein [Glycocaulis profundi]